MSGLLMSIGGNQTGGSCSAVLNKSTMAKAIQADLGLVESLPAHGVFTLYRDTR